ncbi:deoxycytidylate deaminase [Roseobacter phage RDJL Phi 1]|uniref:Deoxycytidylate deaminase n=1 Tax=Roseobacter phage RDJL Phi 1 TaxID=562742 RepID=F4YXM7_9CAUD|nr:deoxycytidylate deaminase [Roseobacter phage RDJL Phi 1]ADK73417.1 deoxycytidylate deaminase [Roseobacter phage RDJL Phi 1]
MTEGGFQKWDKRFMRLACEARTWVKGPDLGVGACVVSPDNRGFSLGYSGLPRGMKDTNDRITETEFKDHHMVHAELNAILNASRSVVGWTLYATTHPCSHCAGAIIQAGIKRVVAPMPPLHSDSRWAPSWAHARMAFKEAGVIFFPYEGDLPCD